jgi:hypothetical protein
VTLHSVGYSSAGEGIAALERMARTVD